MRPGRSVTAGYGLPSPAKPKLIHTDGQRVKAGTLPAAGAAGTMCLFQGCNSCPRRRKQCEPFVFLEQSVWWF